MNRSANVDRCDIARITTWPGGMQALETEAERDGCKFIKRLVSDWHSGLNRFSVPGESLMGAFKGDRLIAVGGLNVDPFMTSTDVGRLRHLYVGKPFRRQGVGTALVERLLAYAKGRFRTIRLRTDMATATAFYVRCGFSPINDSTASHLKVI